MGLKELALEVHFCVGQKLNRLNGGDFNGEEALNPCADGSEKAARGQALAEAGRRG